MKANRDDRKPITATPARIAPLASLPLFHKLEGKRVVLAGDGEGSVWKAELLAAAGAHVDVFAPHHAERFAALTDAPPAGRVEVSPRDWTASDLVGAVFAVAETNDDEEARRFVGAARLGGAVVNVIDRPEHCDVQFGAIVNRSPLVIAISTDGAAPVFGQAIRARIETLLSPGLKAWAQAAKAWRPAVQARGLGLSERRGFWERFVARALSRPDDAPQDCDRDVLFDALDRAGGPAKGCVTLVGAGPGDPELLTLKAMRALQSADVILYDDLVSGEVLELARREAKRMLVGKTGHGPSCKQSDINALMVSLARQGRRVVRLKSGDPLIFGRASEEIDACAAAGIAVDVIPGVSAAQATAAALGFSLTERTLARRVQYLTGHGADGRLPRDICWESVADAGATTVLYMPRKTLAEFAACAIAAGLDPNTPALAVTHASRIGQSHVLSCVDSLAEAVDEMEAGAPMIVIIGAVVRRAGSMCNIAKDASAA
jgi:uroporphyrin-III C-methyltransferase/precorrin-2 dehydrogenase/sirohydrochlorin ferrochelatase